MVARRTIVLHVGAPKTGTSFVQDLLFRNRDVLAERGILYPADRFDAHFLAALDLMELPWGGLEREAVGAWGRLAEQVRAWEGTVLISHEILATASPDQVRRALADLGADSEVHVAISVRDLVRQIPAEWQENVKHRRTIGYGDFLDQIRRPEPGSGIATWFWGVQDIPAILARWGAELPPERVHVVTVPRPGAPKDLLWERFAAVFGMAPEDLDPEEAQRANPSLGVAESAFLRSVNERVNGGVLANAHYRELVRELLAHRTLSHREQMVKLRLPDDVRAWAADLSEQWIEQLADRRYTVVGSLDELRPDPPETESEYADPDHAPTEQLADVGLQTTVTLLRRAAEMRQEIDDLHGHLAVVTGERDAARDEVGLLLRKKRAFVARADESRAAEIALRAYRRARGRRS